MCKILVMPGIKTENKQAVIDFIQHMGVEMTSGNDDGLGYAAFDKDGQLFAERWHNNREAFEVRDPVTEEDKTIMDKCLGFIWKEESYDSYGVINLENLSSIILHTRSATSGKDFCNTHPFIRENTALIHNGIISNHSKFDKVVSSCDSESILSQYLKLNVSEHPESIKDALKPLDGYFACGVLSYSNDTPIVDIFRNPRAKLSAAFIKEFNTIVFTTDITDLLKAAKDCNLTVTAPYKVDTEKMIRYHAITGDALGVYEFEHSSTGYGNAHWNGYGHYNHGTHSPSTKKSKHENKRSEWNGKFYNELTGQWEAVGGDFDV